MPARASAKAPKVVVIGGQFAGRKAARLLQRDFDVTLVDAKGVWEYTPGILRCLVEPGTSRHMVLAQPPGTLTACATGFEIEEVDDGGEVTGVELSDGSKLPADFVILATGSSYASPVKTSQLEASSVEKRREELARGNATLEAASSVLVVGGGTVGVELAAEIVGKYRAAKKVTLVTPADRLLERMPEQAGKLALKWLKSNGVRVILKDRVSDWGGASVDDSVLAPGGGAYVVKTAGGKTIEADVVYPCVGGAPAAAPAKKSIGSAMGIKGDVHVDSAMRITGMTNVFAAGDCADTHVGEERTAFTADLNAIAAAANVKNLRRGRSLQAYPNVVTGWSRVPVIAVVSLYKWYAVMQFNRVVIGGKFPAVVKWFLETMQIAVARGTWGAAFVWDAIEKVTVALGRFLFTKEDESGSAPGLELMKSISKNPPVAPA
jgi:NADH dehydrogenase FAD-containing subunit